MERGRETCRACQVGDRDVDVPRRPGPSDDAVPVLVGTYRAEPHLLGMRVTGPYLDWWPDFAKANAGLWDPDSRSWVFPTSTARHVAAELVRVGLSAPAPDEVTIRRGGRVVTVSKPAPATLESY